MLKNLRGIISVLGIERRNKHNSTLKGIYE